MTTETLSRKDEILSEIEERLKEEKWTRAAIESYSVRNFIELDSTIRIAIDENFKDELKTLCKENLKHYQNSVVGLYIVGLLSLEESSVDDTHIPQIIKLFMDNKKYKIAEFLAEKILSYRESKFALKTLEVVYESYGNQDELFNIKRRLVLIDNRDASNAKYLGEYYEKEGDKDQAMFYYRLAMERYISQKSVKMIEELWNKVLRLYPEDSNMIISLARKIREVLGDERVADMLFTDFIKNAMKNEKYKDALKVLKVAVDLKSSDKVIRKAIEDCYRNIHASHSELEKYLKLSAIGQSWKPHKEAIRVFETHIAFDKGVFVVHKSWGVGQVQNIQNDKVTIDFEGKKGHEMSLEIALRALNVLDDDHLVLWKKVKKDQFRKLMFEDIQRALDIILKSMGGSATTTEVKAQLIPDVLTESEWTRWWTQVKAAIKGSKTVVMNPSKRNVIELRESEMSLAEEMVSRFKKTTNFENKVKFLISFKLSDGDINADYAGAVVNYFREIMNASSESNEKKIISFISLQYAGFKGQTADSFDASLVFGVKNLLELYRSLESELKPAFLQLIRSGVKDWDIKFADFIIHSTFNTFDRTMLNAMVEEKKTDAINSIYVSAMNSYQENPELFSSLSKYLLLDNSGLQKDIGIKDSEIVFRMLSLIDLLNSQIESKENVSRNKKVIDDIRSILFDNEQGMLASFIENSDESSAKSVLSILNSTMSMDTELKNQYVNQILAKYKNLKKTDKPSKIKIRHPFLVTAAAIAQKKVELDHLMTVDIPENSKAIGEAMEKGDLRENAEYKAALEKQDQLKAAGSKLESELTQARALDRSTVDTSIIDVGTRVTLKTQDGKTEEYQILGQWDVDFKKQVISYHSPLGKALLDKKLGDSIEFDFNGETKVFSVEKIVLADFE